MKAVILLLFLNACMLSNEQHLLEECSKQKERSYRYMIPILERFAPNVDSSDSGRVYVINTELVDRKCKSEAKNSRYQLRTN
ncbi:hypothetical protein EHQ58_04220 [Leptospira ognonensis]|uniref:Uncharacterized protein n=1 Tax=Leptospira ognonensis TaxID=2484945 RepID=A0A4R9K8L4_9LEPT|nr:hypothetical protein [Leptospira ognonensis]TGL61826.1 hypothetical protein EHQ58_04220 [Leptospira ognonensis]